MTKKPDLASLAKTAGSTRTRTEPETPAEDPVQEKPPARASGPRRRESRGVAHARTVVTSAGCVSFSSGWPEKIRGDASPMRHSR